MTAMVFQCVVSAAANSARRVNPPNLDVAVKIAEVRPWQFLKSKLGTQTFIGGFRNYNFSIFVDKTDDHGNDAGKQTKKEPSS